MELLHECQSKRHFGFDFDRVAHLRLSTDP